MLMWPRIRLKMQTRSLMMPLTRPMLWLRRLRFRLIKQKQPLPMLSWLRRMLQLQIRSLVTLLMLRNKLKKFKRPLRKP